MPTISSRIVCRMVLVAERRGVDARAACHVVGIDPASVDDVDGQIGIDAYFDLWRLLSEQVADDGFPIEVAATANETHNLLRSLCMSCATMGESMARASRYLRVLTNSVRWPLSQEGDVVIMGVERLTPPRPEHRFADEFGVAEMVQVARLFTGVDWSPRQVRFLHARPASTTPFETFFDSPLVFGANRTEVHIDRSSLELPLQRADQAASRFFESYANKLLANRTASERTVVDEVANVVREKLDGGAPSLDDVAAVLGCSARTLRRRLGAVGTSFQHLLGDVRFELAKQLIADGKVSLAEIAFLLGFSEPSAFHRAFRRWTGTTPLDYARRSRQLDTCRAGTP